MADDEALRQRREGGREGGKAVGGGGRGGQVHGRPQKTVHQ